MTPTVVQYRSLNLSRLRKIRCRVLDRVSGEPVGGVVVQLALRLGDNDSRTRLPVSTLCSDPTGYLSFDLQRLIEAGVDTAGALLVSAPQLRIKDKDLLGELVAARSGNGDRSSDNPGGGSSGTAAGRLAALLLMSSSDDVVSDSRSLDVVFPIWVEKAEVDRAACATPDLPAVQAPDTIDYEVSPFSFVTPNRVSLGDGDCCEQLAPSTLPVEQHSFYKVVIHHERSTTEDSDSLNALVEPVDVAAPLEHHGAARVKFAHVLEYQQHWYSLGHALGEIKYSLPLAPGESTQLAVVEWSREDSASRYDRVRGTEYLEHDLRRDRGITDSIDAGLTESQGGSSFLAGASSGMNYDTKVYGQYTGNWALGGGSSNSWGNRDILADIGNDLHDHVAQGTSFVRSQRSTVIVQATQTERNALQTRRVANHNHCHALTIQYYEVLRHYRLETHYTSRRNAILIPFKPITSFDAALALRFRTLLERALLDEQLSSCFDALIRLAIGDDAYEETTDAEEGSGADAEGAGDEPEFFSGEKKDITVDSATFSTSTGLMIEKGSTLTISAKLGPDGQIKFGQGQVNGFGLDGSGGATDDRWPAKELRAGALCARIAGDKWEVGYGTTHVADEEGELVFFFNDYSPSDNKGTAELPSIRVRKPAPDATTVSKPDEQEVERGPVSKRTDRICEEKLLHHLNANLGHYNRAIWMLMDPAQTRMYLEDTLGENSELLYAIDDVPLTVSGHRVVFPFNGPMPKAAWFEDQRFEPRKSIVTLPTRGLFAEAQLGHCNSCEVRDITRMSDWTEMTTEEPPAIGGITPGPRGDMPQLTPAQLPANVIQITQPPEAPAPTGVSAALGLLGAANVFRDMSGLDEASALLGKLADGTISSLSGMRQTAGEAKKKVDDARKSDASSNGSSGKTRQTPTERYDNVQVAEKMADAADKLGLDDRQVAELAREIIGDGNGGGGGDDGPVVQQAVAGALASAAVEAAGDIGMTIFQKVKDDFINEADVKMGAVEDGFIHLLGYPDAGDYSGPPSGSIFDDMTMYVGLDNLGGGSILDGLYATYKIQWDDGYTLDPAVLKPEHKDKKPYLPYIQCKHRIRVTPQGPRTGKAVSKADVQVKVLAAKQPVPPGNQPAWMSGYILGSPMTVSAEFYAILRITISITATTLGGPSPPPETLEIPIVRAYGLRQTTINIVNKRNQPGFEVDYPTSYDLPINFTI